MIVTTSSARANLHAISLFSKDKTIDGEDPCQYHVHLVGLRTDLVEVANKHCKSWVEGCLDEKEDNTYNYQVEVPPHIKPGNIGAIHKA